MPPPPEYVHYEERGVRYEDDELPVLVIAGNYSQFIEWCRENGKHPKDVIYVLHPDKLRGRRGNPYVWYGTGAQRPDAEEITHRLFVMEAVPWRPEPLRWLEPNWEELKAGMEAVGEAFRKATAGFEELAEAKPERADLGPEWEVFRERWAA